jgi:hypothetical protein
MTWLPFQHVICDGCASIWQSPPRKMWRPPCQTRHAAILSLARLQRVGWIDGAGKPGGAAHKGRKMSGVAGHQISAGATAARAPGADQQPSFPALTLL